MRRPRLVTFLIVIFVCAGGSASAQDAQPPSADAQPAAPHDKRIFGVLPNYATVDKDEQLPPLTTRQRFRLAELNSFDPFVYPFVGVTAGVADVRRQEPTWGGGMKGYSRHYAAAFADNTIGNVLTTAVVPTLAHQDPRYYVLGDGGAWHRAGYAATRTVITRGAAGGRQFNVSELGGNTAAAALSNVYYPSDARSIPDTLQRAAMQVMWDAAANELKEFWPDVRRIWHHD
jgi:hypothetical protein